MDYIEHYDEEKDLAFEIPEVSMKNYASLEELFSVENGIYNASVLSAIYNAVELKLKDVPLLCIKETSSVIYIHEENYEEKLEKCLEFFLAIEEYELCSTIEIIKKKINNEYN